MVDPARHTGLPERTLGELSETSLGKKYLIQTRTSDLKHHQKDTSYGGQFRSINSCNLPCRWQSFLWAAAAQNPRSFIASKIQRRSDRRRRKNAHAFFQAGKKMASGEGRSKKKVEKEHTVVLQQLLFSYSTVKECKLTHPVGDEVFENSFVDFLTATTVGKPSFPKGCVGLQ